METSTAVKIQGFTEIDIQQKQNIIRKQSFQGLFKYPDNTHSIVHTNDQVPEIGNTINTYNFQLMSITEVVTTRPHKGIFKDESKRLNVSIVTVIPLVYEIIKN
ncbi:hypothetical protein [Chryseobacterium indologenes]|uniref:hypothetical protein n=1 Tax=Chryseobacterium indologenes TaxID=253 RepID=UPI001BCC97DB|nr:hypothetical protein [Chryseobacterium indologenes]